MRQIKDIVAGVSKCDECGGEGDYIYSSAEDDEVLAVVCETCKVFIDAILAAAQRMPDKISNAIH